MSTKKEKKTKEKVKDLKEGGAPELNKRDLIEQAEKESLKTEELEKKKQELLEKVKKLKEKVVIEGPSTEELKEQVRIKKKTDMLIPLEEYVKAGIYLGTKVVTPSMKPFIYRKRADGLARRRDQGRRS